MEKQVEIIDKTFINGEIVNQEEISIPNIPETKPKTQNKKDKYFKVLRRIIYLFIWIMVIGSFFGINIINILFSRFISEKNQIFIKEYNFYITISAVIFLILVIKIKRIIFWLFGFLMLPFYIFLIFIPKTAYKGIKNSLKIILGTTNISKTISFKICTFLLFILSVYIVFHNPNNYLTWFAIIVLTLKLFAHFIKRFYLVFRPIKVIGIIKKSLESTKFKNLLKQDSFNEWRQMENTDKNYDKKRIESLGMYWLYNRVFYRLANYLKKSENNRVITGYFIWMISYTFFKTVLFFSLIFYALSNINKNNFSLKENFSFFQSIYFSFTNILGANFGDIIPNTTSSKIFVSLELFSSVIIGLILFFIFTTIVLEKYKKDVDELSKKLHTEGLEINDMIITEFGKGVNNLGSIIQEYFNKSNIKDKRFLKFIKPDDDENLEINIMEEVS